MHDKYRISVIKPLLSLMAISVIIFTINRFIDIHLGGSFHDFLAGFYAGDPGNLTNAFGGLGEVITAVLGIEITAIAIIVQLAANKYSSKIMDLFIENKVNVTVLSLYIIAGTNTILVTNTIKESFVPYWSVTFTLIIVSMSMLLVIPHFSYVFNFLRPENFLNFVKSDTIEIIYKLAEGEQKYSHRIHVRVNNNLTFLGDVLLNSVYQSDRAVALLCLDTLSTTVVQYLPIKNKMPEDWFKLNKLDSHDPDFSNYSKFVLKTIEERKVKIERKVFRLYEIIYNITKQTNRDVASGVLYNSETIALSAIDNDDEGSLHTAFQYFNSYLRYAITAKDSRSAFNTLEHYRDVAERLIDKNPKKVEEVSFYFKYYGQEANKYQVLFILETAAHDLCKLNELAFDKQVENIDSLLSLFLTLDERMEEASNGVESKERSLIGVRVAQTQLAAFYLLKGAEDMARRIYEDMNVEPMSRIKKIEEIIFSTTNEEFWEITPRGINFYYVPPERRQALKQFFSWFAHDNNSQE